MKCKLLIPGTTGDTVPVDFKLDKMLRKEMRVSSFRVDFHEAFKATFLLHCVTEFLFPASKCYFLIGSV